ncbi:MAG: hypothetical protein ACI4EC_11355, partial [Lachnospiraceae bacterium]
VKAGNMPFSGTQVKSSHITVNSRNTDGSLKNDRRLLNILGEVGLADRYIPVSEVDRFDLIKDIDYGRVTSKRMEVANESIGRLINAIEGNLDS